MALTNNLHEFDPKENEHASEQRETALDEAALDKVAGGSQGAPGEGLMFGPYLDNATDEMRSKI